MAASWPSTLQQYLNETSFGIEFAQSWLESETQIGPKKRRRRTTQNFEKITCSILLDKDFYLTFKNFYDVTLNGGVLPFEFPHPITQVMTNYRMSPPQISILGGTTFSVTMGWEEIG